MEAPSAKRRKIRKGTTSCWECKRRKVKCEYDEDNDSKPPCKPCIQRGSQCVSQELPEPASQYVSGVRVLPHAHVGDVTAQQQDQQSRPGIPTPVSTTSDSLTPPQTQYPSNKPSSNAPHHDFHSALRRGKHEKISHQLLQALPSREDIEKICTTSSHPATLAHELNRVTYATLQQQGVASRETLLHIPSPDMHPILIARYMLLLASYVQQLNPTSLEKHGLSTSPKVIMERLVDVAVTLATTNDELLGSIEGLECIMIEGLYQANIGNLRRAWVSIRRALTIGQLMGLNRPNAQAHHRLLDSNTKYDPQHMWFRIVFLDRYLCLMLGLSQGSYDRSMAAEHLLANDTPMGRLERIHCVVASKILERNELQAGPDAMALTYNLDLELQRAAKSLPSKWWLTPRLESDPNNPEALFWSTRQLFAQILHYNLLNQLHLPYMLCSAQNYEYSRLTCVNASREMLSRFIALCNFNRSACSCRIVDFLALMAAMTLLLAHLHGQRMEANVLAHQYHSDRAMIEQVQENMEEVNRMNADALSAQSANLLRKLLAIDAESMDGAPGQVSVQPDGAPAIDSNGHSGVSVRIPYFGVIKIAREGMSREINKQPFDGPQMLREPPTLAELSSAQMASPMPNIAASIEGPEIMPTPGSNSTTSLPIPNQYPGLAAGTEDWAFQGVDLAFFDSIMRSTKNEDNDVVDWGSL